MFFFFFLRLPFLFHRFLERDGQQRVHLVAFSWHANWVREGGNRVMLSHPTASPKALGVYLLALRHGSCVYLPT